MNELAPGKGLLHIDDILGASSGRYFGSGYRRVSYRMYDVSVDAGNGAARMLVDIRYPAEWSQKRNRELQPHLSTLDAMTIAGELADLYIRHACGIGEAGSSRCWLRRAVIKASVTPTTDLSSVPASITWQRTEPCSEQGDTHTSYLTCQAGSMTVELAVEHPATQARPFSERYASIEEALGPSERRHYALRYKNTSIDLDGVDIQAASARATMTLRPESSQAPAMGLSSEHEPFVSIMYGLIAAAQVSQVLLYQQDSITRETSNNMWLRRLSADMQEPRRIDRPLSIQTQITKTSVVPMRDARWRSTNFITSFPGVHMEYNLAHELGSKDAVGRSQ